jgi:ParB-like chromosome segregation protein Spo0J
MKAHDYANLFPMLPDSELKTLADDIRENGLQTPITTLDGLILDGRNRHRACEIAGVDPTFDEYLGGDPLQFVISHNLHRRHLTESQRGMVAAKLATMRVGNPQFFGNAIASIDAITKTEACEALKVGVSTLDRARKIQRIGSPELIEAVQSGEVTVGAAYKVAELPHEEQVQILSEGPKAVAAAGKKLRQSKESSETSEGKPLPASLSTSSSVKIPKYIPQDGLAIWATAKSVMDRILPQDTQREAALLAAKQYIETRIEKNK